jgi:hypothetical protein
VYPFFGALVYRGEKETIFHENSTIELENITDAIEISRMVRKGATSNMDKFAASLNQAAPLPDTSVSEGCGCGS